MILFLGIIKIIKNSLEDTTMDTSPSLTSAKKKNGHWLWLVGVTAFLIPALQPPFFLSFWLSDREGGLIWALGHFIALTLFHVDLHSTPLSSSLTAVIFLYGPLPIILSIVAVLLWSRI